MAVKRLLNIRPQYDDGNGALASNYRLFFYAAGSSTKQNTYNSSAGTSANLNPIVLNALGEPPVEIWGTVGQTYKIGLAIAGTDDPPASFIWTEDNIAPINDTTVSVDQWVAGPTPTFVSGTSFTLSGDQTSTFHIGRRLKSTNTSGTVYSTITNAAFAALTTITVANDSGTLDSGLSAVSYDLLSNTNHSIPSFQAKGDLLTQSAAGTLARRSVGLNGTALVADSAQASGLNYVPAPIALTAAAGTNTVTATSTPAPSAYATGQNFFLIPAVTNTAATTLNVSGLGAKNVFFCGAACSGGELVAGVPALLEYDGTQFNIIGPAIGSRLTNALSGDVTLNNTANYFDGPIVAQGTVGAWFASGSVTVLDTTAASTFFVKLWDGTTVIASVAVDSRAINAPLSISLSGFLVSPAASLRISVRDTSNATGLIKFNTTGSSKDSIISAIRIG